VQPGDDGTKLERAVAMVAYDVQNVFADPGRNHAVQEWAWANVRSQANLRAALKTRSEDGMGYHFTECALRDAGDVNRRKKH
jgi:hypothetical protein